MADLGLGKGRLTCGGDQEYNNGTASDHNLRHLLHVTSLFALTFKRATQTEGASVLWAAPFAVLDTVMAHHVASFVVAQASFLVAGDRHALSRWSPGGYKAVTAQVFHILNIWRNGQGHGDDSPAAIIFNKTAEARGTWVEGVRKINESWMGKQLRGILDGRCWDLAEAVERARRGTGGGGAAMRPTSGSQACVSLCEAAVRVSVAMKVVEAKGNKRGARYLTDQSMERWGALILQWPKWALLVLASGHSGDPPFWASSNLGMAHSNRPRQLLATGDHSRAHTNHPTPLLFLLRCAACHGVLSSGRALPCWTRPRRAPQRLCQPRATVGRPRKVAAHARAPPGSPGRRRWRCAPAPLGWSSGRRCPFGTRWAPGWRACLQRRGCHLGVASGGSSTPSRPAVPAGRHRWWPCWPRR